LATGFTVYAVYKIAAFAGDIKFTSISPVCGVAGDKATFIEAWAIVASFSFANIAGCVFWVIRVRAFGLYFCPDQMITQIVASSVTKNNLAVEEFSRGI
jgi:formate/nitrite transporter FocA (FNT family)